MNRPELLAPAGNLERLKVAVLYGATAVYVAGQKFGLRGGSDNFSDTELRESVAFAHQQGTKVYTVLNAFPHDSDLVNLPEYIRFLASIEIDALIVSDLGTISIIRQISSIPIHLSTQASCLNIYSARAWKKQGVRRLILAREVSLAEAGWIRQQAQMEVELFIHGSMCMAYSGNCVISNYTAGRDSNRGGCVQSCRFEYQWSHGNNLQSAEMTSTRKASLLSSRDLRGLELLPALIENQIDSIKIEGRMKSNLYVATTVSTYAKALEICQKPLSSSTLLELEQLSQELRKIPHRNYTSASLQVPAGASSIYYGERSGIQEYEIAGTILEVKSEKYLILWVQNPFTYEDTLEFLTFQGDCIAIPVKEMKDIQRKTISCAKPNSLIQLPYDSRIQEFNLARRRIKPQ